MRNYFIMVNPSKELAQKTRRRITGYFNKHEGANCTIWEWDGSSDRIPVPEGTECIITVGGDGTLIQAARSAIGMNVKLIGVNRGHIGYLTELADEKNIEAALDRLVSDDFVIEERMMMQASVFRGGKLIYRDIALNEVQMCRHNTLKTLHFEVYVNDVFLSEYSGDGILAATPTGSTAYSLSAGGPIAEPKGKFIILTALCPHVVTSRPIILDPDDVVKIVPVSGDQLVSCDSATMTILEPGDEIVVRRSEYTADLIRLNNQSFLEVLRSKLAVL